MNKLHIRNTALLLGLLAVFACVDDAEFVEVDDLGVSTKEVIVAEEGGIGSVSVYTNKPTSISFIGDCDWAEIKTPATDSDVKLIVECQVNTSYPRHAKIELVTPTRRDTCLLLQEGALEEKFNLSNYVITTYDAQPKELIVAIESDNKDYDYSVRYINGIDWMTVTRSENKIAIVPTANNSGNTREAQIRVSWTDGWEKNHQHVAVIRQTESGESLPTEMTFAQVREEAGLKSEWKVTKDVFVEGYVINEKGGNVGECYMEVMDRIDYDSNETTVYFEDENADYGFRLICKSSTANIFMQYTKVKLNLNGCTVVKYSSPERYDIKEVSSENIIVADYVGKEQMPVKQKSINELIPSDIYTYVTLKECELPIRKGSLTPVNEGYTRLFSADKIAKYPTLVRDEQGSSIYMYTNITCTYRRDGSKLPYGSGDISGVIVSEKFDPFGQEIGPYQIRHLCREDIALAQTMEEKSFSALLTEYRFLKEQDMNTKDVETFPKGAITPTHGNNGWMTNTGKAVNVDSSPFDASVSNYTKFSPTDDYSYLGLCGGNYKGARESGFGIVLEDGKTDYGVVFPLRNPKQTVNKDGKGTSFSTMAWVAASAWKEYAHRHGCGVFDGDKNKGKCTCDFSPQVCNAWVACFSTTGYGLPETTDVLSAQVSMYNSTAGGAKQWKVQYLVPEEDDDIYVLHFQEWTDVMLFTIPDIVDSANTKLEASPGFKPINIPLPAEKLWGKDKVYIRIMPTELAKGGANAMNYFAVRYNK